MELPPEFHGRRQCLETRRDWSGLWARWNHGFPSPRQFPLCLWLRLYLPGLGEIAGSEPSGVTGAGVGSLGEGIVNNCGPEIDPADVDPDVGSPRQTVGADSRVVVATNGEGAAWTGCGGLPRPTISGSGSGISGAGRELVDGVVEGEAASVAVSGRANILCRSASNSSSCWRVRSFGLWAVAMASFRGWPAEPPAVSVAASINPARQGKKGNPGVGAKRISPSGTLDRPAFP